MRCCSAPNDWVAADLSAHSSALVRWGSKLFGGLTSLVEQRTMRTHMDWSRKKVAVIAGMGALISVAADFIATAVVGENGGLLLIFVRTLLFITIFFIATRWVDRT